MTEAVLEKLRGLPFAQGMEPHQIGKLAALATEVDFEKDQIIFREGDTHNQFYVVLTGKVALEITAKGRVFRVQTVEAGDELGWSFMLAEAGKHFQARALRRVSALAFDGDQLQKACREDTAFGYELLSRILRIVSSRLQATRLRILEIYAPEVDLPTS